MNIPAFLPAIASTSVASPTDLSRQNRIAATMTCQQADLWCWAAVIQTLERCGGHNIDQANIATEHVSKGQPGLVCAPDQDVDAVANCGDPCQGSCNSPHVLSRVLVERGLQSSPPQNRAPAFDDVVAAIDAGKPLPVRMQTDDGGGHFLCVIGYADDGAGNRFVDVLDPIVPGVGDGDASLRNVPFDTFTNGSYSISGETGTPNFIYDVLI